MKKRFIMAWRNLWRNRKRTMITLASIIFAVVIATFMRGLQLGSYDKMLDDAIRSTTGHIALMDKLYWDDKTLVNSMELSPKLEKALNEDQSIDFWAPEVNGACLASSGNHTRGVMVLGVDVAIKDRQMKLSEKIIAGTYLEENEEAIIIGKELSQFLKLNVGDTLILLGQGYQGMTAAAKYPVKGIFDHPMSDFNKRLAILPISAAQYLFYMEGRLSSANIVLKDQNDLEPLKSRLENQLDTAFLEARAWPLMNEEILSSIESDNFFGKIMIGILYMVIGFGIFGTILMMTMERKKEFSIMIAIGMNRLKLVSMVVVESIYIAIIGAFVGLAISFPVVYFYSLNPIPITGESAETYRQMNIEPVLAISTKPDYMVIQFLIILGISVVASVIPMRNIMKFNIVDIIRGKQ